jgi:syntaxin 8
MMAHVAQLFLLADHIKLSLLERQRAISLDLEPNTQDGEISWSLESLQDSLESLESSTDANVAEVNELRLQYQDLSRQFYGDGGPTEATSKPTDSKLTPDFVKSSSARRQQSPSLKHPVPQHPLPSKSVRFTDADVNGDEEYEANRAALLPYRDEPSPLDHSNHNNQQIHEHHSQIMQEQDDHLDQLGQSIGRQHQLSIQIGDELEGHVALLDEVDGQVDRHTSRLDHAKRRLDKIRRKAGDNWSLMTIIGLIIVLVILIVILK